MEEPKDRVKNGGPAFPPQILVYAGPGREYENLIDAFSQESLPTGMTLRDWFAGQILSSSTGDDPEAIATDCYRIADAMIAEREK